MKLPLVILAFLAAGPVFAQSASAAPAMSAAASAAGAPEGVGQIKAVDGKAGTLTLHHGPIAALGWPAMTMTFKASPLVLQAAKAGQTVKFTLKTPENEIVAIEPQ